MDALKKLEVWRRACRFSVDVYKLLRDCNERVLRDQLSRSALSVASNIAEGYGRDSAKDRIRFLHIAKASCSESWTQLLIGIEAGLLEQREARRLAIEIDELSKMLQGLVRHLNQKETVN